jgi:hypothetical protein
MAWPRSARKALATQLTAELAIERLMTASLERWLPEVRAAVEPGGALTAALSPEAVLDTRSLWSAILDSLMLHGMGYLYSYEMKQALDALGYEPSPPTLGAIAEAAEIYAEYEGFDQALAQQLALKIVAASLGVEAAILIEAAGETSVHPYRRDYLANVRNRMDDVPEATFRQITRELDAAVDKGEDVQRMAARVAKVLGVDEMSARARRVARTETAGALTSAVIDAAKATGTDELEKTWVATMDSRTRKSHYRADGQRVPINGRFSVGKAELRHPGDSRGPAEEVVNCRCAIFVLRSDEADPGEKDRESRRKSEIDNEIDRRADDGQTRARDEPVGRVASATNEENTMTIYRAWSSVLAEVGVETDDGRMLHADIDFTTRDFPLPLMWQKQSEPGHYSSFAVGVIEAAERNGNQIVGSGYMLNTPEALEAIEEIGHGVTRPSVDLGAAEWILTDQNGDEIDLDDWWEGNLPDDTRIVETMTKAKLLGATLVSIPAFAGVSITLGGEVERGDDVAALVASLVASGDQFEDEFKPRRDLFGNPKLTELTPVTYDEKTGRVFGHLAPWGKSHISVGETAPRSPSGYRYFHTSHINTDNGPMMVGKLTVDTGHAGLKLAAHAAASHYDHTGSTWAYVCAGEDAHGIWVSGVLHPFATADKVHDGLASPLSGDWREIGGAYELVAGLSVNVPGFPLVAGASKPDGSVLSLVAALSPRRPKPAPTAATIDVGKLADEVAVRLAEINRAEQRKAEAARLVDLAAARKRKAEFKALIAARK